MLLTHSWHITYNVKSQIEGEFLTSAVDALWVSDKFLAPWKRGAPDASRHPADDSHEGWESPEGESRAL
jgi:hypothetical protein